MDALPLTVTQPYTVDIDGQAVTLRLLTGAQVDAARSVALKRGLELAAGLSPEALAAARARPAASEPAEADPCAGLDRDALVAAALVDVGGASVAPGDLTAYWRDRIAARVAEDNVRPPVPSGG